MKIALVLLFLLALASLPGALLLPRGSGKPSVAQHKVAAPVVGFTDEPGDKYPKGAREAREYLHGAQAAAVAATLLSGNTC